MVATLPRGKRQVIADSDAQTLAGAKLVDIKAGRKQLVADVTLNWCVVEAAAPLLRGLLPHPRARRRQRHARGLSPPYALPRARPALHGAGV